jgi:hypothetical protein
VQGAWEAWSRRWRAAWLGRERLRHELMRRDASELALSEYGSWSGMVLAVQELVCWRAGASVGAAGTWAAPSKWRERARDGVRKLAAWTGVEQSARGERWRRSWRARASGSAGAGVGPGGANMRVRARE